ncbi:serine phosphatase RsbU (regulator of sigma subunit) [Streptomyces rishiriensis]|uniref:Serine phosphatase RsbU (Regulator of sigma subunit) n=2 Tax=Streptomyces rishiriensis TaxID=68264 RepID=A0ABU0NYS4_STRRH|nr:PP2C family protein-serine/threonine phosphatase [Streptomyces rishiriensis]MDQ0584296.1 serine phosphatase RsbU (regulator of sigma subunit) [Streptomyces rishiriensis]
MTAYAKVASALTDLMLVSHVAALEDLPEMVAAHVDPVGLHDVAFFVVDLQGKILRQVTGRGPDAAEGGLQFMVHGTVAGLAFQRVDLVTEPDGTGRRNLRRWWVPITDGVERLGVLRADTTDDDESVRNALRALASMVALLLLSKRSHSDSYARLIRTAPMSVAAEMQWHLTPPSAFAGRTSTVGAASEPAYEVGGDAFDYAVADDTLHLSIFDAMGHDATAGLTANMAVATCRNARRQGAGLVDTSQAVEEALVEQFGTSRYVTGILADLDLTTGRLEWINRGHHLPVLIRDGRWPSELQCPPAGPMGVALGLPVTVCHEQLQPGDRLLLYTDGVVEARNSRGELFGLDRFVDFVVRHHADRLTVQETLRRLTHAVLDHHDGRLDDDATVLLAEWRDTGQDALTP